MNSKFDSHLSRLTHTVPIIYLRSTRSTSKRSKCSIHRRCRTNFKFVFVYLWMIKISLEISTYWSKTKIEKKSNYIATLERLQVVRYWKSNAGRRLYRGFVWWIFGLNQPSCNDGRIGSHTQNCRTGSSEHFRAPHRPRIIRWNLSKDYRFKSDIGLDVYERKTV